MTRLSMVLLAGIAFIILIPNAPAQTCQPYGTGGGGPTVPGFNYIANGEPDGITHQDGTLNCWTAYNAIENMEMACGMYGQKFTDFEFSYGGEIDQQFDIPATSPHTSFTYYELGYEFDFINSTHQSAWDLQLNIQVWDITTGRVLITDHYDASQPDVTCTGRHPAGVFGNLAGHTILVRIMGNNGSTLDHIRVKLISFWGS